MKVTTNDVANTVSVIATQLANLGVISNQTQLVLEKGNATNGYPWRLFVKNPDNGGLSNALGLSNNGAIGFNAKEAYKTLWTISAMLDLWARQTEK